MVKIIAIGQEESEAIWNELQKAGYISENGEIQENFDPKNPDFELKIDSQYDGIKLQIIDEIQRHIFENRVANARKRCKLKLNKHVQLSPEFMELWGRIKQRTRYSVRFDSRELIERALEQVKRLSEEVKPGKYYHRNK